ncbi:hypothetical protein COT72_03975 [archaeon CG10_big_fil_rev_8_21_14_0_10_43_11]|nr:MAG: hypothetical protein COT72_03975 [archaeon CG10_big_fil_rev_8_21_14_0_10_43_11]
MKIGLIVFGDWSKNCGNIVRPKNFASMLEPSYNVKVLSTFEKTPFLLSRIPPMFKSFLYPLYSLLWYLKILLFMSRTYDVFLVSGVLHGFFLIAVVAKLKRIRLIYDFHGIISEESREFHVTRRKSLLERFIIRQSDFVICASRNITKYYRREYGVKKIQTINNIIDESVFYPKRKNNDVFRVALVGPFDSVYNKNTLNFVEENVACFSSNIEFFVIGKSPQKSDSKTIHYLGYVENYADILASNHVLLVIPLFKTSGSLNKILEAAACEIPTITNDKGVEGLNEFNLDSDIILLNNDEIVNYINKMSKNFSKFHKTGSNARKTVLKNYSFSSVGESLHNLLQGVFKSDQ